MRRHHLSIVIAAGLLAACGGSKESASSGEAVAEAPAEAPSDAPAADSGAAQASLDTAVAAIQGIADMGYQCTPESMAMTSASRAVCIGFSSVGANAYAWADAATMAAEIDAEVYCIADSGLGSLTSVRGDNWAISLVPTSGATPEAEAKIAELAGSLSSATGGTAQTDACV